MPSINQDLRLLNIDSGYVELFVLDCSGIGGSIYHFTNCNPLPGQTISFGGTEYLPVPIAASGFETKQDGSQDRPTLQVSNVNKVLLAAVINLGDIVGARITRYRTLAKYLDSGSNPNSAMVMPPDVFYISKKTAHSPTMIQFELCTALEKYAIKLPRRQVTRAGDSRWGAFPAAGRTRLR